MNKTDKIDDFTADTPDGGMHTHSVNFIQGPQVKAVQMELNLPNPLLPVRQETNQKPKPTVIPKKELISYFSPHSCVLSPDSSPSFAHFHLEHIHSDFHNQYNFNITTTIITWEINRMGKYFAIRLYTFQAIDF